MGQLLDLSRREILFGSAAMAGGVAFGSYAWAQPAPPVAADINPLATGLARNAVTFNPWVEISPEKIILIAQHADKGQGVGSIQPLMIAEELDLERDQFEVRFAGPSLQNSLSRTPFNRAPDFQRAVRNVIPLYALRSNQPNRATPHRARAAERACSI